MESPDEVMGMPRPERAVRVWLDNDERNATFFTLRCSPQTTFWDLRTLVLQRIGTATAVATFYNVAVRYHAARDGSVLADRTPWGREKVWTVLHEDDNITYRRARLVLKDCRPSFLTEGEGDETSSVGTIRMGSLQLSRGSDTQLAPADFLERIDLGGGGPCYEEFEPPVGIHYAPVFVPAESKNLELQLLEDLQTSGLHFGVLSKELAGKDEWKERHFILTPHRLWYCRNEPANHDLSFMELVDGGCCQIESQRDHEFCVATETGPCRLRAPNGDAMTQWMRAVDMRLAGDGLSDADRLLLVAERSLDDFAVELAEQDLAFLTEGCSLKGCLQNPVLRHPFVEFLERRDAARQLLFWSHAESFFQQASLPKPPGNGRGIYEENAPPFGNIGLRGEDREIRARFVYDHFLAPNAPRGFDLPPEAAEDVAYICERLAAPEVQMFKMLQDKLLLKLSETHYLDFVVSPMFRKILCAAPHPHNQNIKAETLFNERRRSSAVAAAPVRRFSGKSPFSSARSVAQIETLGLSPRTDYSISSFSSPPPIVSPLTSPQGSPTKRVSKARLPKLGSMLSRIRSKRGSVAMERQWQQAGASAKASLPTSISHDMDISEEFRETIDYKKMEPQWPPSQWWSSPDVDKAMEGTLLVVPETYQVPPTPSSPRSPVTRPVSPQRQELKEASSGDGSEELALYPAVEWTGLQGWVRLSIQPLSSTLHWYPSNPIAALSGSMRSVSPASSRRFSGTLVRNALEDEGFHLPAPLTPGSSTPGTSPPTFVGSHSQNADNWSRRFVAMEDRYDHEGYRTGTLFCFKRVSSDPAHGAPNTFSCSEAISVGKLARIEPDPEMLQCLLLTDHEGTNIRIKIEAAEEDEPHVHLNRWITLLSEVCAHDCEVVRIVKEGSLGKRGRINTSYKRRWMRLDSAGMLRYFHDTTGLLKGEIPLDLVTDIEVAPQASAFVIKADERSFHLSILAQEHRRTKNREAEHWVQVLEAARPRAGFIM